MFEHGWKGGQVCDKCKKTIEDNVFYYSHDKTDQFVFCELCYNMILGDIHELVFDFVNGTPLSINVITNDRFVINLLRSESAKSKNKES